MNAGGVGKRLRLPRANRLYRVVNSTDARRKPKSGGRVHRDSGIENDDLTSDQAPGIEVFTLRTGSVQPPRLENSAPDNVVGTII